MIKNKKNNIIVLTLFPELYQPWLEHSIIKKAIQKDLVSINVVDFRNYSTDKHHKVDDYSYGGNGGMVLKCQPIYDALLALDPDWEYYRIFVSPQGKIYSQLKAKELLNNNKILILCGHYEGVDERILNFFDEEISLGDYVLTGGEIPSLVLMDSIIRLIPNVIKDNSFKNDSFYDKKILDYPQYTKPRNFNNLSVPSVLLKGNHDKIKKWRNEHAIINTFLKRKDLWAEIKQDQDNQKIINDYLKKREIEK